MTGGNEDVDKAEHEEKGERHTEEEGIFECFCKNYKPTYNI
jgi:hypothetical protein